VVRHLVTEPEALDAQTPPEGLAWHYTDGPGLISILSGHSLWATSAWFLNDREEVALGGSRMASRIRELAAGDPTGVYAALEEEVLLRTRSGDGPRLEHFHVLSASTAWDSLAMWRLYGGAQESYAIGLDPSVPLAVLAPGVDPAAPGVALSALPWREVCYSAEEQRRLVDDVVLDLPARAASLRDAVAHLGGPEHLADPAGLPEPTRRELAEFLDDVQEALLLIKHEGFADERETRYAVVLAPTGLAAGTGTTHAAAADADAAVGRLLSYRATAYGVAPYLRLTGGGPGDPTGRVAVTDEPRRLPVRAVAVSPSPNGTEALRSVGHLLRAHGYGDVSVVRSRTPFRG